MTNDCPNCGYLLYSVFAFGKKHQCPPRWEAWAEWNVEPEEMAALEGVAVADIDDVVECVWAYGYDAQEAAEALAATCDIEDKQEFEFWIRPSGSTAMPVKYKVAIIEYERTFSARKAP